MNRFKLILSSIILIASNLVPLIGVMYYGWSLTLIMFLYWSENIVIGIYNILKMNRAAGTTPSNLTINGKPAEAYSRRKLVQSFIWSYGLFTLIHGLFVMALFGLPLGQWVNVGLVILALILSHGLSYWINFIQGGEYGRVSPAAQFNYPYQRIGILHLTIILGAIAAAKFGTPIAFLIIMVMLKTAIDLIIHNLVHRRINQAKVLGKSAITIPEKRSEAVGFLVIILILFIYFAAIQLMGMAKAPFAESSPNKSAESIN